MTGRVAWLAVLMSCILLAGCAEDNGADPPAGDEPRVSTPAETDGPQTRAIQLLEAEVPSLGTGDSWTWTIDVPANVSDVRATFVYESRFLHEGLHMTLDGCGTRDYTGPGGALEINRPGTWTYRVCDIATPGLHDFTVTLDLGSLSDAVLRLGADQLVTA